MTYSPTYILGLVKSTGRKVYMNPFSDTSHQHLLFGRYIATLRLLDIENIIFIHLITTKLPKTIQTQRKCQLLGRICTQLDDSLHWHPYTWLRHFNNYWQCGCFEKLEEIKLQIHSTCLPYVLFQWLAWEYWKVESLFSSHLKKGTHVLAWVGQWGLLQARPPSHIIFFLSFVWAGSDDMMPLQR